MRCVCSELWVFDFDYHDKYMHTRSTCTHVQTHTQKSNTASHACVDTHSHTHTCSTLHTAQHIGYDCKHLNTLFTGLSAAELQGKTHFISTDDAIMVLDCNTPEDSNDEVLLYEWIFNGVHVNSSDPSLSVSHTGAYVCYVHLKQQTLTAVHRVLPHGMCGNSQKCVKIIYFNSNGCCHGYQSKTLSFTQLWTFVCS